jgi:hypothetical protein
MMLTMLVQMWFISHLSRLEQVHEDPNSPSADELALLPSSARAPLAHKFNQAFTPSEDLRLPLSRAMALYVRSRSNTTTTF